VTLTRQEPPLREPTGPGPDGREAEHEFFRPEAEGEQPAERPGREWLSRPAGRDAGGGTIRRRVARILALPAVVVLLLLSLVAAGQIQDYQGSQATSNSVKLALAVQDLSRELQTERGVTAGVLGGNNSFRAELKPARRAVDLQRSKVESLVRNGGDVESQVSSAAQQLDGLGAVRAATDASSAGRGATFDYFTDRIAALSNVDVGLDNTADSELRRGVAALQALDDLTEATAQERAFLNGVFSAGGFAKGEFVQFAAMRADRQAALTRFNRFATPSQRAANRFVFDTGAARTTADFEQVAIDAADGRHIVVNPQSWWSGLTTVLDDLRQLQQHVGSEIQVRAHDLQQGSLQRIGALVAFVLLCVAGSIYLAVAASMSITRPLATLAAEADSVAAERLPEAVQRVQSSHPDAPPRPPAPVQVPARATEEIRSVATALDRLQAAAYGLATEQAVQRRDTIESLANLGRRNQNLIRRQLGFITSLEREEIDPSALANLFELDHLATRMRRNAASLLVLVDASSPRQWSTAVSVADVIRAAVSEVEEYRRVSLRRVDDAMVSGSAIGSIAHLLSELIENGLTFSPPDTEVEVQGRRLGDGYLIAITDQGVGMSPEDLRQANSRLRGEGDFIAAPTRFLGHFVVGKLANATSIGVELLPSPVTGVTARVTLPASLLSGSTTVEVQAVTDAPSKHRHSEPVQEAPVQLTSPGRLALAPPSEPTPDSDTAEPSAPVAPAAASRKPGGPRFAAPVSRALPTDPDQATAPADPQSARARPVAPEPPRPAAASARRANGTQTNGIQPAGTRSTGTPSTGNGTAPAVNGGQPSVTSRRTGGDAKSDPDLTPPSGMPLSAHPAWGGPPVSWPPTWDVPTGGRNDQPDAGSPSPRRAAGSTGSVPAHNGSGADSAIERRGSAAFRESAPFSESASSTQPPPASGSPQSGSIARPGSLAAAEAERTRNGLRKRTPRVQRTAEPTYTRTPNRVIDLDSAPRSAAIVNDSPAQVSARLTALRAGIQRGKAAPAGSSRSDQGGNSEREVKETE
jgi:signal transduction histidine kinase